MTSAEVHQMAQNTSGTALSSRSERSGASMSKRITSSERTPTST